MNNSFNRVQKSMKRLAAIKKTDLSNSGALLLTLSICVGATLFTGNAQAQGEITGDAAAGKGKAAVCGACHGADGKALQPEYPNLAGQGAGYIAKQLADYKSGDRENAIMAGMVAPLSDQDMADLAAYFSSLPPVAGVAEEGPELTKGENIYRGGITAAGIAACIGCHGPSGQGNPAAAFPQLAGQNAKYVILALESFRSGQRQNDPNEMMRMLAHRMTDAEMAAVANYIQGLN